jgi:hypothetical protein
MPHSTTKPSVNSDTNAETTVLSQTAPVIQGSSAEPSNAAITTAEQSQPEGRGTETTATRSIGTSVNELPPEALAFATRMFNAARAGDVDLFRQAIPAGLPVNLTNEKGDTLVCIFPFFFLRPLMCLLLCSFMHFIQGKRR